MPSCVCPFTTIHNMHATVIRSWWTRVIKHTQTKISKCLPWKRGYNFLLIEIDTRKNSETSQDKVISTYLLNQLIFLLLCFAEIYLNYPMLMSPTALGQKILVQRSLVCVLFHGLPSKGRNYRIHTINYFSCLCQPIPISIS